MSRGKLLAICQSGGEFVANSDGSLSYSGGEAHAIDIDHDMTLHDFMSEISTMFNCDADSCSIKYFLPGNSRTLITVSSDKDLKRMVDFHADSITTDVYVLKKVENRAIRSVVADSAPPTDAITAIVATDEDVKQRKICTDWENLITGVGQVFASHQDFRDTLQKYAIAQKFVYKFIKNEGSRITVACAAENCPWRIHASKSSAEQDFMIKKMDDTHTCEREIHKDSGRLASQRWVASVVKEKVREIPDYKPRDIANDLEREYGLSISYTRAWRGKFVAKKELQNSHEEACNELPWYCEKIRETNPGSFTALQTTEDSRFLRFFVSFHASLNGFEHGCRPFLFLDAVSLKVNKQWKLLAATGVDGENDIFPAAFAVVEAENDENWLWFLVQLKSALSMSRTMTFVSDKKNGLEEAVPQVFEDSFHGYSVDHLIENFKAELDESWTPERKDLVINHLTHSVYACRPDEFNGYLESIKSESKELAEWILASDPETWSDAYFKGLRYSRYSSSAAATFNEWVSARHELSVVQIVDMIRCKMMEMIYTRRESSNAWTETLTPYADQKVREELTRAHGLDVICSNDNVFEVRDDSINVVNVETWECTCRRWQVNGLPCMHALAVFERTSGCMYDYCSNYFSAECYRLTYALSINPIPDAGRPLCTDPVHNKVSYPLRARRPVGRPREKPANPCITFKRSVQCSRCKEYGHNKKTCKTLV